MARYKQRRRSSGISSRTSKKLERQRRTIRNLREKVGSKSRSSKFWWIALGLGVLTSPLWFKEVYDWIKSKVFESVVTTAFK